MLTSAMATQCKVCLTFSRSVSVAIWLWSRRGNTDRERGATDRARVMLTMHWLIALINMQWRIALAPKGELIGNVWCIDENQCTSLSLLHWINALVVESSRWIANHFHNCIYLEAFPVQSLSGLTCFLSIFSKHLLLELGNVLLYVFHFLYIFFLCLLIVSFHFISLFNIIIDCFISIFFLWTSFHSFWWVTNHTARAADCICVDAAIKRSSDSQY